MLQKMLKRKIIELLRSKILILLLLICVSRVVNAQKLDFVDGRIQLTFSADSLTNVNLDSLDKVYIWWEEQINLCPKGEKCVSYINIYHNLNENQLDAKYTSVRYAYDILLDYQKKHQNREIVLRPFQEGQYWQFLKKGFFCIEIVVYIQ